MEQTLGALSAGLAELTEQAGALAVAVEARSRMGSSGILWQQGVIVTADHAVRREEDIPVLLSDGSHVRAELAGRDPGTDLAILRFEGGPVPKFESAKPRSGELVLSVGRHEPGVLAAVGIISTAGGEWRTWRGGQLDTLLRLDISAYPRSSGSVVVDSAGRVVGMLTSGLTRTAPVAVPFATIERVAGELIQHGHIARGYLGVGLQPVLLPEKFSDVLGRKQRAGVIVLSVEPGGPAEGARIGLGDIFVELGGREVEDTDDVQAALAGAIGQERTAVILRGGERVEVAIRVGERRV